MKNNEKWVYIFTLSGRVYGVFTTAWYCVALWRGLESRGVLGDPKVIRTKPNHIHDSLTLISEDITDIIRRAL